MPLIIAEAVEVVLVVAVDLQEEGLAAEEEAAGKVIDEDNNQRQNKHKAI